MNWSLTDRRDDPTKQRTRRPRLAVSIPPTGLAAIAIRRDEPERAARLLGAASVTGPDADADVTAHLENHFFAAARAQHGTQRWNDAHAKGAQMSFEEAIAFALSPSAAHS